MDKKSDTAIIVFAKEPAPGKVKTRLANSTSFLDIAPDVFASEVYKACLTDLFSTLTSLSFPLILYTPDDSSIQFFTQFCIEEACKQEGHDLGQRMYNAFKKSFLLYKKLLLIGSDLPQLSKKTLESASQALDTHDCVLGPAFDGGYYLIGFTKQTFCNCFDNIVWSTNTVLQKTLVNLKGRKTYLLDAYQDIDTEHDLQQLVRSGKCTKNLAMYLSQIGYTERRHDR